MSSLERILFGSTSPEISMMFIPILPLLLRGQSPLTPLDLSCIIVKTEQAVKLTVFDWQQRKEDICPKMNATML